MCVLSNGVVREETLFHTGALAAALSLSRNYLAELIRRGRFPETPFKTTRGHRLYTLDQIESASAAMSACGYETRKTSEWVTISEDITRRWEALYIFGAYIA
jgi:hypothetical protein